MKPRKKISQQEQNRRKQQSVRNPWTGVSLTTGPIPKNFHNIAAKTDVTNIKYGSLEVKMLTSKESGA